MGKKCIYDHPLYNITDDYYKVKRPDKVIIFRLGTGHNRLRSYLFIN